MCRPECVLNTDCPRDKACVGNKCRDPCPGTCGVNANCEVINHISMCVCPDKMTGNPFVECRPAAAGGYCVDSLQLTLAVRFSTCPDDFTLLLLAPPYTEPCNPSPCGPYSQCRAVNGQAVCSCVPGYVGSPPACRPECIVNSDCGRNEACSNQKCRDPCPGTCGVGARCEVVNHNPICSCPPRYTGDPFTRCRPIRKHSVRICNFHGSAI